MSSSLADCGVGKTTIARELARHLGAVHVRIDSTEPAIRASGTVYQPLNDTGYHVGYAVAEDNLRLGRTVIADSINPLRLTRDAWIAVASRAQSGAAEIEVTRSDPLRHRERLETRPGDISGLRLPTWEEVVSREYEPWNRAHIVIDATGRSVAESVKEIREILAIANPSQILRHHLPHNTPNHLRPMFARSALQRIRPLKTTGTGNLHLPPVIRLGAHNRNLPISRTISKHMLNDCHNLRPQRRVSRVMHLHQNCHTKSLRRAPSGHGACFDMRACQAANFPSPFEIPTRSEAGRSIIWGYGKTSRHPRSTSQARQSQLGAFHSARPGSRDRIRTAGPALATHRRHICLLARATTVVPAEQESVLHPRMAAWGVGYYRRSKRQRRSITIYYLGSNTRKPNQARTKSPAFRGCKIRVLPAFSLRGIPHVLVRGARRATNVPLSASLRQSGLVLGQSAAGNLDRIVSSSTQCGLRHRGKLISKLSNLSDDVLDDTSFPDAVRKIGTETCHRGGEDRKTKEHSWDARVFVCKEFV